MFLAIPHAQALALRQSFLASRTSRPHSRRSQVPAAAASGGGGRGDGGGGAASGGGGRGGSDPSTSGRPFNEDEALVEAAETYKLASTIAANETRVELMQSFNADGSSGATTTTPLAAGDDDDNGVGAPAAPPPTLAELPLEALALFWEEQGLRSAAAERLASRLQAAPDASALTLPQLRDKVAALRRVLVDCDVAALVSSEPGLVAPTTTTAAVVANVVELVAAFPGRDVLPGIVSNQPQLLVDADLRGRIKRITAKLLELHPSDDYDVIADLLVENPVLLYRMDYYLHVYSLDELPIELLNMFVLTGHGLGHLYRWYGKSRKQQQQQQQQQDDGGGGTGSVTGSAAGADGAGASGDGQQGWSWEQQQQQQQQRGDE